jgi:hypothetical protein
MALPDRGVFCKLNFFIDVSTNPEKVRTHPLRSSRILCVAPKAPLRDCIFRLSAAFGTKIAILASKATLPGMRIHSICIVLIIFSHTALHAQEAVPPRSSPLALASAKYKDSYLKITYSQPHRRGREIFGKLVPYGEVWRLGANEATELTITRDVFVNGQLLMAGTYSLFAVPEKEKWTLIVNRETGQWGSYNYNIKSDVFRFEAPVSAPEGNLIYEPFTIKVDANNNKALVTLVWERTLVSFNVDFIEPKP